MLVRDRGNAMDLMILFKLQVDLTFSLLVQFMLICFVDQEEMTLQLQGSIRTCYFNKCKTSRTVLEAICRLMIILNINLVASHTGLNVTQLG